MSLRRKSARALIAAAIVTCFAGQAFAAVAPASATSGPAVPAFVVDGGAQVELSGSTRLVLDCDLHNFGAFSPAPGSEVVLTGYGSPLLVGAPAFSNLTLALNGTAAIANPVQVGGTLKLTSGTLSVAGHDLTANAVSGGSAASYVMTPDTLGRLVRTVDASAAVNFPVGDSQYDPVTIRTGTGSDAFRVAVLDAPPTAGLVPATALTRAWAIAHANASGVNGSLALTVQWNVAEQGAQFDRSFTPPNGAWAWRWLGATWVPQSGVRTTDNGALVYPAIDGLATPDAGLWTLAGAGNVLDAGPGVADAPRTLELEAPTPNPALGPTSIRYGVPARGRVTLALYSLQGQRVVTLVDGTQEPGFHAARFDGTGLPAGIYFCQLRLAGEVRSRRLTWLR